jgi:hypothetical protein
MCFLHYGCELNPIIQAKLIHLLGEKVHPNPGHENKDLLSEAINSFRLFDILKLWEWEAVHLPWEAVPER